MRRFFKDGKSLRSEGIFESKKIREAPIPSISMINTTKAERIKGNILPETDIVVKMIILWILPILITSSPVISANIIITSVNNDKSPGSDGYTTEFFKFFFKYVEVVLLRSVNYGFEKG